MGTFKLEILLGTRAMKDRRDVTDALGKVRTRLAHGDTEGLIRDRDNHVVGNWELQDGAQLSFDDESLHARVTDIPHARSGDPGTSHISSHQTEEEEGGTSTLRPRTTKHVALALICSEPMTAHEVERRSGRTGIWKRVSDLKNAGLIKEVDIVVDPITKRPCIVWGPEPGAFRVLEKLNRGETVQLDEEDAA